MNPKLESHVTTLSLIKDIIICEPCEVIKGDLCWLGEDHGENFYGRWF